MRTRSSWLLLLLLPACGRTELAVQPIDAGLVARPPVLACPAGEPTLRLLATAAGPVISSLGVEGNELYVASHEAFLPMRYRLRGKVEQFSRCGGPGVVLAGDEDRPEALAVSPGWVHWRSADTDTGGSNTRWHVKSVERLGPRRVDRTFPPEPSVSGPVVHRGVLRWLETVSGRLDVRVSEEDREAQRTERSWAPPTGTWSVFPAGEALLMLRRDNRSMELSRYALAPAQVLPLWSAPGRPDLFTASGDALFYATWDAGLMARVIKRHPATDLASATVVHPLGTTTPTAMIHADGALYFADATALTRLTLATGLTRSWPLAVDSNGGETVSGLAYADGRLYLARSWSFFSGEEKPGTVWVIDLP